MQASCLWAHQAATSTSHKRVALLLPYVSPPPTKLLACCLCAGILFVGNQAANGVRTQDYVEELNGLDDHKEFVARGAEDNILKVGTLCTYMVYVIFLYSSDCSQCHCDVPTDFSWQTRHVQAHVHTHTNRIIDMHTLTHKHIHTHIRTHIYKYIISSILTHIYKSAPFPW